MEDKKDGGPAFPILGQIAPHGVVYDCREGMTLRDYFAAKALPALIALYETNFSGEITQKAYFYADAMLESRKE